MGSYLDEVDRTARARCAAREELLAASGGARPRGTPQTGAHAATGQWSHLDYLRRRWEGRARPRDHHASNGRHSQDHLVSMGRSPLDGRLAALGSTDPATLSLSELVRVSPRLAERLRAYRDMWDRLTVSTPTVTPESTFRQPIRRFTVSRTPPFRLSFHLCVSRCTGVRVSFPTRSCGIFRGTWFLGVVTRAKRRV